MDPTTPGENAAKGKLVEPLLYTVEQAANSLAICRTKVYELLRSGELKSIQIGTSRRIPVAELEAYVQRLRQKPHAAAACSAVPSTVPHRPEER